MIRSLYAKIFIWFWLTTIGVAASVVAIALLLGAEPLGVRWMSRTLDFYARSAVDFYRLGGTSQLQAYLDDIERSSGIHSALLGPGSTNILGRPMPPGTSRLLKEAQRTGQSQFRVGMRWSGASVVPTLAGNFIFIAQVRPIRGTFSTRSFALFLLRIAIALISAGLLCFLLARHIAGPIRSLQAGASQIAAGNLAVRAAPALAGRNDELADLARDFDSMAERIEALLKKQQDLLGEISHELRSPLARLGVSLELVRRGHADAVERMQVDLNCLDALIGQILTLTRLQNQENQKAESRVYLRSLVENIATDARFEGQAENKSVIVAHADDCWLEGDPALLRSCIENVVRNAVRYTKPGTGVVITLQFLNGASPPCAQLVVTDYGEGVPPETLSHLFEPFYRVSSARDRISGGSGLGLSITQRVALFHGGFISARNRESGGLEVEIRLPAHLTPR